jgi:hypothetical protein
LVPIRIMGVEGAWCVTSGIHYWSAPNRAQRTKAEQPLAIHCWQTCGWRPLMGLKKVAGRSLTFYSYQLYPVLLHQGRTVLIFSKLGGETTEKQTKKTSVWG